MVRRVVTGHDDAGRAIVVSDGPADAIPIGAGGLAMNSIWGRDEAASFPDDGTMPTFRGAFPPVGGFRYSVAHFPPGTTAELDRFVTTALAEWADPDHPGMHRTASLDIVVVLSGTLVLELDDGKQVTLGPGDVVVQNGTKHRWRNPGDEQAAFAGITIGAHHELVTSA